MVRVVGVTARQLEFPLLGLGGPRAGVGLDQQPDYSGHHVLCPDFADRLYYTPVGQGSDAAPV